MANYANRGKGFEDYLELVHGLYRKAGTALMVKIPTPFLPQRNADGKVDGCIVRQKSVVDYIGRYRSIPVAVEAKHTVGGRIRFDAVKDHQAAFLDSWTREEGAVGLVLVSFSMERYFAVPWYFWKIARDLAVDSKGRRGCGAVSISSGGKVWTTPGAASATPEHFLREWEVIPGGRTALPYLDGLSGGAG